MNKLTQIKSKIRYKLFSSVFKSRIKANVSRGEQLLLYIYALLGTSNKVLVDIGCATSYGSNSANLILNHQWTGLLLDGSDGAVDLTNSFYASFPMVRNHAPIAIKSFVTAENINTLIKDSGIEGDIDLLSIDIDGVDFWVWKAIDAINPRVVIVEYQPVLGAEESLTVPYKADFYRHDYEINSDHGKIVYAGASLAAFNKLAKDKGYSLVACNTQEFNAFFIRDDVNNRKFPEIPLSDCFIHPRTKKVMDDFFIKVKSLPWDNV